jgi:DedD protein
MGLLSSFKRQTEASTEAPAQAEPDAVAAARTRARRRLIGATVLLGVGVIGFPLLFETQPRPIAVNIPIEIPRKDGLPPLALPPASPALSPLSPASAAVLDESPAPVLPAQAVGKPPAEIVERATDQGRELTPTLPAATPPARPAAPSAPIAAVVKPPPAASKPAVPKPTDDGARARALLDGQSSGQSSATAPASAPAARMVVQVGAYADAAKLAEARQKLEKLGLKTYTQVVEVDGAKRTRVRVGPFATRADADKAAVRIKAAGLPVAILTL